MGCCSQRGFLPLWIVWMALPRIALLANSSPIQPGRSRLPDRGVAARPARVVPAVGERNEEISPASPAHVTDHSEEAVIERCALVIWRLPHVQDGPLGRVFVGG